MTQSHSVDIEQLRRVLLPLLSAENWESADNVVEFFDSAHRYRARLLHETDIVVEWGRQEEPDDTVGWRTPWARERIITEVCDVWQGGQLVDRVILARVGGRALVPLPLPVGARFVVSGWERDVSHLVHDLEGLERFDELMAQCQIETVSEWPAELLAVASPLPMR